LPTSALATGRTWTNASGEKQEKTEWHRIVIWNTKTGKLADIAEEYVKKGDKLYLKGSIEYRQWLDKEGQTRYSTEINVRELIMLGGKPQAEKSMAKTAASPRGVDFDDFPGALEDADDDGLPF